MKILFLTRFNFIEDKKNGGVLASARNYEMLCELYGEENVILYIIAPHKKEDNGRVRYFSADSSILITYFHYLMLKDRISGNTVKAILQGILTQKPDLIFYDSSTFGQIISDSRMQKINSIVFFHNIERQYTWEQVKKHSKLCIFRYLATRYNERKMAINGSKVICLNSRDARLLKRYYQREPDMVLPITFKDTYELVKGYKILEDIELLYVGSYYAHNYSGLIWFIKNVMPYIDRHLTIVGKDMNKLSGKIKIPANVHIVGTVEDISQYYRSAYAVVMPVFMGGGMKVKTAEAMMYGKTIFASQEALEGYIFEDTDSIYLCNSAHEFVHAINRHDFNQRGRFIMGVRQIFLENYCTDNYISLFKEFLEAL